MPIFRQELAPVIYPAYVGAEFPLNAPFRPAAIGPQQLPIHATVEQDLRPVHPSYINFGPHYFPMASQFARGVSHIALAMGEHGPHGSDAGAVEAQNAQTNRLHHEHFGWERPAELEGFRIMGGYLLHLARKQLDWGAYGDRPLLISMEGIRSELPIKEGDRYAYDEMLHTDATHPLWPVAQVFWANTRHTMVSTSVAYIGEGSESLKHSFPMDHTQPTNVVFANPGCVVNQLEDSHLVIADSKRLPHGRPNLAEPLRPGEDSVRYYLRAYISPLLRKTDELDVAARNLGQIEAHYGRDIVRQ